MEKRANQDEQAPYRLSFGPTNTKHSKHSLPLSLYRSLIDPYLRTGEAAILSLEVKDHSSRRGFRRRPGNHEERELVASGHDDGGGDEGIRPLVVLGKVQEDEECPDMRVPSSRLAWRRILGLLHGITGCLFFYA